MKVMWFRMFNVCTFMSLSALLEEIYIITIYIYIYFIEKVSVGSIAREKDPKKKKLHA